MSILYPAEAWTLGISIFAGAVCLLSALIVRSFETENGGQATLPNIKKVSAFSLLTAGTSFLFFLIIVQ